MTDAPTTPIPAVPDDVKPWPLFGYAPGNYMCRCVTCERQFEGDKRAIMCLDCAAKEANRQLDRSRRPARDEVIEECALICDGEAKQRWANSNAAEAGDTSWGLDTADVSRIQGHKAVTATGLAKAIRSLTTKPAPPAYE